MYGFVLGARGDTVPFQEPVGLDRGKATESLAKKVINNGYGDLTLES